MDQSPADNKSDTPVVMIVDDEPMVIRSLESLLQLETEYRISSYQSPVAALDRLKETPVDIIVSDFMMPDMNGLEFLREARSLHPDVPRIMLTGYADKENAIQAINEVGLFHYVEKPWDNDYLKMVIRNGLEQRSLRAVLKRRIRELDLTTRRADRLHEEASLLQDELDQARGLLHELLPGSLPSHGPFELAVHFQPAMQIGGDFYDTLPLAGNRRAVLLADLTGHGIKAALSTALLKFAFSRFSGKDVGPTRILEGINSVLHDGLPSGVFAAAALVVIDIDSPRYHIANAGAPHPLLLRRSSRKIERVFAEGLLLGVAGADEFPDVEVTVVEPRPGDGLLLMTDGVTETELGDDRHYGDGSLQECLRAALDKTGEDLLRALESHRAAQRANQNDGDDVTMLIIDYSQDRSTP